MLKLDDLPLYVNNTYFRQGRATISHALQHLLKLLKLEKIEEGLFRGQSEDLGLRQVFGGQVVGQALYAAKRTVEAGRGLHSFHSYFLLPGDSRKPIVYDVQNLRDGNSFSARRVSAIQNGKPIFFMTASFQRQESGFEHQNTMPEVPGPESLSSEQEIAQSMVHLLPEQFRDKFLQQSAIEMRPVKFHNPLKGHVDEPVRHIWCRANGTMPNDERIHKYLLGYTSDCNFLLTALQTHGVGFLEPGMQVATIDHSMWFHRPFRLDDWLFYTVESTSASGARGFVRGQFYTRDGILVASTVQQGIMRRHDAS